MGQMRREMRLPLTHLLRGRDTVPVGEWLLWSCMYLLPSFFPLQCVSGVRRWPGDGDDGETCQSLHCTLWPTNSGQSLSCPGFDTVSRSHGACSQTVQSDGKGVGEVVLMVTMCMCPQIIPGCHAILLGVNGSGRKCLCRFVAYMMRAQVNICTYRL